MSYSWIPSLSKNAHSHVQCIGSPLHPVFYADDPVLRIAEQIYELVKETTSRPTKLTCSTVEKFIFAFLPQWQNDLGHIESRALAGRVRYAIAVRLYHDSSSLFEAYDWLNMDVAEIKVYDQKDRQFTSSEFGLLCKFNIENETLKQQYLKIFDLIFGVVLVVGHSEPEDKKKDTEAFDKLTVMRTTLIAPFVLMRYWLFKNHQELVGVMTFFKTANERGDLMNDDRYFDAYSAVFDPLFHLIAQSYSSVDNKFLSELNVKYKKLQKFVT